MRAEEVASLQLVPPISTDFPERRAFLPTPFKFRYTFTNVQCGPFTPVKIFLALTITFSECDATEDLLHYLHESWSTALQKHL